MLWKWTWDSPRVTSSKTTSSWFKVALSKCKNWSGRMLIDCAWMRTFSPLPVSTMTFLLPANWGNKLPTIGYIPAARTALTMPGSWALRLQGCASLGMKPLCASSFCSCFRMPASCAIVPPGQDKCMRITTGSSWKQALMDTVSSAPNSPRVQYTQLVWQLQIPNRVHSHLLHNFWSSY